MSDLLQILGWPLLACIVIAGIHAYLGFHVVERGVIFVDLALAQVAALGATVGFLMGLDLHDPASHYLSIAAVVAGALLLSTLRAERRRVPQEAFIGIVYAVSAAAAILIVMLSATTILSQFFRSTLTVIAPELIVELKLTPEALGLANAIFFLALLAAQVPVGILFDRIGVRWTVGLLAGLGVAGALWHAAVRDGNELIAARFLLGLGFGGSFMSVVVLCSRWYPRSRWATAMSCGLATGSSPSVSRLV